ncbi:MAG: ribosomal-processing cysteine protease Prp [Lachnospiraceae bacterium]|nr:ribosomal-processing cysteine protease Prp [Lachnospiraceae bacterium]
MITITIYQNQKRFVGVSCEGHAGFARAGKDIVCAAVSMLVINTINGIEQYTEDAFTLDVPQSGTDKDNNITFRLTEEISSEADVLMKTLVLGLTEIQKTYGDSYLTLNFKEV